MRKRHIMHLIGSFEIGGAEKLLLDFAEHFPTDEFSLTLIYFKGSGALLQNRPVRCKVIDLSDNGRFSVLSVFKLIRIIRKDAVDILHVHDPQTGLIGRIVSRICGISMIVVSRHIPELVGRHRLIYWLENRALRRYSRVIVNSRAVQQYIYKKKYTAEGSCNIVYNGIDMQNFTPLKKVKSHRHKIVIGTVARLKYYKGIDILLRAFSLVHRSKPNVELHIVGDGDEREKLKLLASQLGISESVLFHGGIESTKAIAGFLGTLEVFILPSRTEGFGISLVEAMAMKIPVIGSRIDGISEVIQDKVTGLLFESENEVHLKELIEQVIDSEQMKDRIAAAGFNDVRDRFTIQAHVEALCAIYRNILGSSVERAS